MTVMVLPPDSHPLDLKRMFIGDETPLFLVEIAVRTTVIFLFTLLLLRLLGKRGVRQHSLFEVTIIIGLGAARRTRSCRVFRSFRRGISCRSRRCVRARTSSTRASTRAAAAER